MSFLGKADRFVEKMPPKDAKKVLSLLIHFTSMMNQTKRDSFKITKRIKACGDLYSQMEKFLWPYTVKALYFEAQNFWRQTLIAKQECPRPGRLETRRADALTCWFCENHSDVLSTGFVSDLSMFEPRQDHRGRQRFIDTAQPSDAFATVESQENWQQGFDQIESWV
jgi:hypothetical protein